MRLILTLPLLALGFLGGCSHTPSAETTTSAVPAGVNSNLLISTDQLGSQLDNPKGVILHVTRSGEKSYAEGHIPGARLLPLSRVTTTRDEIPNELPEVTQLEQVLGELGISNTTRVVVYDDEDGLAAARVFVTLDYLGHGDKTALLDGHLAKWKKEGRIVSMAPPTWEPATFVATPNPKVIADLAAVQAVVDGRTDAVLMDARSAENFTGAKAGDGIERAGHIPTACNVPSTSNFTPGLPVLKSPAELQALYPAGKPIVVYCRTGGQASQAYFAARYLGRDVQLYDGSFTEWSNKTDAPVKTGEAPAAK